MAIRASDFASEDDWLDALDDAVADARQEAREDAAYDEFLERAWTCSNCGEKWDPIEHRATRHEPAYVEQEECPHCGGQPTDD